MARVVDFERQRVEQLAVELVPVLRDRGVVVDVERLESEDRWRRAARRARRLLGWRVVPVSAATGAEYGPLRGRRTLDGDGTRVYTIREKK